MIFLLGSVKLKIGFALGLFAIFGIIRYRTESMPVREMTYLFVIIAISVINALAVEISYAEPVSYTHLVFGDYFTLVDNDGHQDIIIANIAEYKVNSTFGKFDFIFSVNVGYYSLITMKIVGDGGSCLLYTSVSSVLLSTEYSEP